MRCYRWIHVWLVIEASSPEAATLKETKDFRLGNHGGVMSESVVRNTAIAVPLRPHDWHVDNAVAEVGAIGDREARGCQNMDRRVDVHVVLLRDDVKHVWRATGDEVIWNTDVNGVIHATIARMRDPLATRHELILGFHSKAVAHSAVATRDTNATLDRCQ